LHPGAYVTLQGTDGGQPASVLGVRDQSGTQNNWNKYVEFDTSAGASPSYMGYRTYTISTSIAPTSVQSLQVQANYLGGAAAYQRWTWHMYDWTTGNWVAIGDNSTAADWYWTLLTFNAGGTLAHYINAQGEVRIDVEANNASDNADLDYEALLVNYASGLPASTATATGTAVLPTATKTATSVAPTPTSTPIPPTAAKTATSLPPTSTSTATGVPPTSTSTSIPPTATSSPTAPTSTKTATSVPPTSTSTSIPPTATSTVAPPTATSTPAPAGTWHPTPGTTWFWEIGATPNLNSIGPYQVYDIDGFDNPSSTVAALHAKGIKVICYMDAGTAEPGRPDSGAFPAGLKGTAVSGWPGEYWLDVQLTGPYYSTLQSIMTARAQLCKTSGFDAIEWDNVDSYENSPGFPTTAADQLAYNTWLAGVAHGLGLSVALKNDTDQVATLEPKFDFAIDEECFKYSECSSEAPFINDNKAVLETEYSDDGMTTSMFCSQANALQFSSALATLDLNGSWTPCW